MTFTLTKGTWEWWWMDSDMREPLTAPQRVELIKEITYLTIPVPPEVIDHPNAIVHIQRIR